MTEASISNLFLDLINVLAFSIGLIKKYRNIVYFYA